MRRPTAVVDLDLTQSDTFVAPLDERFADAQVLCRLSERPIGFVEAPVVNTRLAIDHVVRELTGRLAGPCGVALAERAIASGKPLRWPDAAALIDSSPHRLAGGPLVTIAVCTRDRTANLHRCLESLTRVTYEPLDLLVVDNAPSTDETAELIRTNYPAVRYVRESSPGLDRARNRAIAECRGEILAFTDDDVVVDRYWVSSIVRVFLADAEVMAVTGLVIPDELETNAQRLFEAYGGFGRGFVRRWYRAPVDRACFATHGGTGGLGTGANMAFWRKLFDDIGGFDPALDVGTCTKGGGDLDMFFRVLKAGHTLVYEPSALVRHRHRRTYQELRRQIADNGVGFYSYLSRTARAMPDERSAAMRFAGWWFAWWSLRRMALSVVRKLPIPMGLVVAEARGSLAGLRRYDRARQHAEATSGTEAASFAPVVIEPRPARRLLPEAQRHVDLADPLRPIADVTSYDRLRLVVSWNGSPIGSVTIEHHGAVISTLWLSDAIAQRLTTQVLDAHTQIGERAAWSVVTATLAQALLPAVERWRAEGKAPETAVSQQPLSASVVVATYDRPRDLAALLRSLTAQRTHHQYEVIVVDNHPASGITREVLRAFPAVRLVEESRGGLSYARNAGILAARGEIVVTTDDDVVVPPEWIDRLMTPFQRADVMVVCGNVLPLEIENDAQRMFEAYGGLGRGFVRRIAGGEWFQRWRRAVPTWELGCTANAAFRTAVFRMPEIGLMDEALGAGTPTGCSEDTYVFYRVLKAGYSIAYEPDACVWHRHRATMAALRSQIYSYAKGHAAYQLTTLTRDGDWRALVRLCYELPRTYARRTGEWLRGGDYPFRLIALEVAGTVVGPFALWRSRQRVRRLGQTRIPTAATQGRESHPSFFEAA